MRRWSIALGLLLIAACARSSSDEFAVEVLADFDQPWAMAFLPDGRLLVTEKRGNLKLYAGRDDISEIPGLPPVAYGGQGGLGDIVLHPDFSRNGLLYFSYAEEGDNGLGAVVARGRLIERDPGLVLDDVEVIWRQVPKVPGRGHYGHRIAFGPAGYLWISSGERQKFSPAQDMQGNLGKIVRLDDSGDTPADNPFADQGGVAAQIWSLGHRNPLGLAFDPQGRLWSVEMGPKGGDELNLVQRGANYGYPEVSEGRHYNGAEIPAHATRPEFKPPVVAWTPVISPSSLMFYTGGEFSQWQGSAFVGGLSSKGLVRLVFHGEQASEAQRLPLGARVRAVAQGPDGALWVLEDEKRGSLGRLLRLSRPPSQAVACRPGERRDPVKPDDPCGSGITPLARLAAAGADNAAHRDQSA
jgi:glucose/arabinose dehydrogenase